MVVELHAADILNASAPLQMVPDKLVGAVGLATAPGAHDGQGHVPHEVDSLVAGRQDWQGAGVEIADDALKGCQCHSGLYVLE